VKRLKPSLLRLSALSDGRLLPILMALLLPLLILSGFGLFAVIAFGYALQFAMALLVGTLLVLAPMLWLRRRPEPEALELAFDAPDLVGPSNDWSAAEQQIWRRVNRQIDQQLSDAADWTNLKDHCLAVVVAVAREFDRTELQFSLTDGLGMAEEVSRRYRRLLQANVPYAELLKASHLSFLYQHQDHLKVGKQIANAAVQAVRAAQFLNPAAAVIRELRNLLVGELFGQFSERTQWQLKRALLQEVASVSIDLYSGRFSVADAELQPSQAAAADRQHQAAPLEPLRVTLVGQVSAGKSSLINALQQDLLAEVSAVPSTDEVTVYQCTLGQDQVLSLVDLPGLDATPANRALALREITQSDLVLWLLKADQPARQLDQDLMRVLDAFYADRANLSRKQPPLIGVLNQVDRLKPQADWDPPYDLNAPETPKARQIQQAMEHNRRLLGLERITPLCLAPHKAHDGLEAIEDLITQNLEQALHTQLNRQRLDARHIGPAEQAKRALRSGMQLFRGREDHA